ncbi:MAG: hypothetical protein QXZ20_02025 [Candidatus Aenigmatarchaeota archaeon]
MRGICAIGIGGRGTVIVFASSNKNKVNFLEEFEVKIPLKENSFLDYLYNNSEIFEQRIKEKDSTLRIEKVFLVLPCEEIKKSIVEDTILLKKYKKISYKDIVFAKKNLEDIFLSLEDVCLHHFNLEFEIEKNIYNTFPIGVFAKKIKLKSQLIYIKQEQYKRAKELIDSWEKEFGGVLAYPVGIFKYIQKNKNFVMIDILYDKTYVLIYNEGIFEWIVLEDLSLKKIFENVQRHFSIPSTLVEEIFDRYVSFKEIYDSGEINIKKENDYVNLSIQSLNNFIKDYIKEKIANILEILNSKFSEEFLVSVTGELNKKERFFNFIHNFIPQISINRNSMVFNCLDYSAERFLERVPPRFRNSFLNYILNIYKDYF